MSDNSFPAKFSSTCNQCKEDYPSGTLIAKLPTGWGHAYHLNGSSPQGSDAISPVEVSNELGLAPIKPLEIEEVQSSVPNLADEMSSEFRQKLAEIDQQVKKIQSDFKFFEKDLNDKTHEYKEFGKKVRATDEDYIAQLRELQDERKRVGGELQSEQDALRKNTEEVREMLEKLRREAKELNASKADLLEMLAAQQTMKELEERLKEAFENSVWGAVLKPFQHEDIVETYRAWFEGQNGVLNANVMGAGKTLEVTASLDIIIPEFVSEHDRAPRILWITKKSLRQSTSKEIRKWSPDTKCLVIDGGLEQRQMTIEYGLQFSPLPIFIINYEMLNTTPLLIEIDWDIIVIDEVHKLKGGAASTPTQVFTNTQELLWDKSDDPRAGQGYENPRYWKQRFRFFIPLSGSPIQNHPKEMWPYLHLFKPEKFPSVAKFERDFVREVPVKNEQTGYIEYKVRADLDRLLGVLEGQVIRQDPELIWSQRPEKQKIDYEVEHTEAQAKIYNQIRDALFMKLESMEGESAVVGISSILPMLTYLREANVWPDNIKFKHPVSNAEFGIQCGESAKLDQAMELIEEISNEGEQVVVWSAQFKGPLYELKRRIEEQFEGELRAEIMDGDSVQKGMAQIFEEEFQQGKINVLLCNRASVSEGFNFQKNKGVWPGGSRHAIFLDLWWNPEGNNQAEDRIWRQGATEGVMIHRIFVPGSVDEFMLAKIGDKAEMISEIMGSEKLRPKQWIDVLDALL